MDDELKLMFFAGVALYMIITNMTHGGRKLYFKRKVTVNGGLGGHKWEYGFVPVSWAYRGFLFDKIPKGAIEISKKEYREAVK